MKTLIKALLFIITLAFLCHCDKNDPNPSINIPNNNFLNALIELGVDTDGDGIISAAEAEEITYLDVGVQEISDLTGIEAFVNLDTLNCGRNQLTSLDVSNNTLLDQLYLRDMPSLFEVCVWEIPFPPDGVNVNISNSPNVFFTTDCN